MTKRPRKRYHSASTKLSEHEAAQLSAAAQKLGVNTSEYLRHLVNKSVNPLSFDVRLEIVAASVDALQTLLRYLLLCIAEKETITPDLIREELRAIEAVRLQRIRRAMGDDFSEGFEGCGPGKQTIQ